MDDLDPSELVETLHRLLRGLDPPGLAPDSEGWVTIEEVCSAASIVLSTTVHVEHVRTVGRRARRFEISGTRIRVLTPQAQRPRLPDILFHATTEAGLERVQQAGALTIAGRRRIYLSEDQDHAWRAAHRLDGPPRLLVVDTLRARRAGVRFARGRQPGLYTSTSIPARHVLNLREGYAEQWSAGGIPVRRFEDGRIRMALIQVTRRSGVTWEVAKGKLEPAESPEDAAVREVREEMGIDVEFRLLRHVGDVLYGFLAPGGAPRLKTIFLYLMEPQGPIEAFAPAEREGIGQVQWFTPDEAVQAVTHTSLQPLMWRARELVARYGLVPSSTFDDADATA